MAAWIARVLAVLASAAFAFFTLVRPAAGLTFLWDDWAFLGAFGRTSFPERWIAPSGGGHYVGHFYPLFVGLLDVEHALLGPNHDAYLLVNLALHATNVALVLALLERATRSIAASALAASAFGVLTVYREALWWAELGGLLLAVTILLAGWIGFERALEKKRGLAVAALSVGLAPCAYSAAIVFGPILAAAAWLRAPREDRKRFALALLVPFALYAIVYVLSSGEKDKAAGFPRTSADGLACLEFLARELGLGFAKRGLFVPGGDDATAAAVLSVAFVATFGTVVALLPARHRPFALMGLALFLAAFVMVALGRWSWGPRAAVSSRYQYLPAAAFSLVLGPLLAAALARSRFLTASVAVLAIAVLAALHASAARDDDAPTAPRKRRDHALLVERMVEAARTSEGPIYDAPLPLAFPAHMSVSQIVSIVAPGTRAAWTTAHGPETIAPYEKDPLLRIAFPKGRGR